MFVLHLLVAVAICNFRLGVVAQTSDPGETYDYYSESSSGSGDQFFDARDEGLDIGTLDRLTHVIQNSLDSITTTTTTTTTTTISTTTITITTTTTTTTNNPTSTLAATTTVPTKATSTTLSPKEAFKRLQSVIMKAATRPQPAIRKVTDSPSTSPTSPVSTTSSRLWCPGVICDRIRRQGTNGESGAGSPTVTYDSDFSDHADSEIATILRGKGLTEIEVAAALLVVQDYRARRLEYRENRGPKVELVLVNRKLVINEESEDVGILARALDYFTSTLSGFFYRQVPKENIPQQPSHEAPAEHSFEVEVGLQFHSIDAVTSNHLCGGVGYDAGEKRICGRSLRYDTKQILQNLEPVRFLAGTLSLMSSLDRLLPRAAMELLDLGSGSRFERVSLEWLPLKSFLHPHNISTFNFQLLVSYDEKYRWDYSKFRSVLDQVQGVQLGPGVQFSNLAVNQYLGKRLHDDESSVPRCFWAEPGMDSYFDQRDESEVGSQDIKHNPLDHSQYGLCPKLVAHKAEGKLADLGYSFVFDVVSSSCFTKCHLAMLIPRQHYWIAGRDRYRINKALLSEIQMLTSLLWAESIVTNSSNLRPLQFRCGVMLSKATQLINLGPKAAIEVENLLSLQSSLIVMLDCLAHAGSYFRNKAVDVKLGEKANAEIPPDSFHFWPSVSNWFSTGHLWVTRTKQAMVKTLYEVFYHMLTLVLFIAFLLVLPIMCGLLFPGCRCASCNFTRCIETLCSCCYYNDDNV